jgi:phosphoacetylglucosamine mutase
VVRVYAEAETTEDCESLAAIVCGIVFDFYGGVGERPAEFKRINKESGDVL